VECKSGSPSGGERGVGVGGWGGVNVSAADAKQPLNSLFPSLYNFASCPLTPSFPVKNFHVESDLINGGGGVV
jgi:hypothetical protein